MILLRLAVLGIILMTDMLLCRICGQVHGHVQKKLWQSAKCRLTWMSLQDEFSLRQLRMSISYEQH